DASVDDPAEAYRVVRDELAAYGAGLELKPEVVALTKSDLIDARRLKEVARAVERAAGSRPIPVSAPLGEGLEALLDAMIERVGVARERERADSGPERPWSPL
ncbi:MAG TPA: GTPase ObgE, partial [Sphingomicrobium sp.]